MIHGDLKGVRLRRQELYVLLSLSVKANILVDQSGHARLADFGLLTIISDATYGLSSGLSTQGGSARWMGPELINWQRFGLEDSRPTKASDCYALGMVIYETISGRLPFHKVRKAIQVFAKVLNDERPPREVYFTDTLWRMLEMCWKPQPDDRPSIEDVLQCLETEILPPRLNVEIEEDDGDSSSSFSL